MPLAMEPVSDHALPKAASEPAEAETGGGTAHELGLYLGNLTAYPLLNIGLGYSSNVYRGDEEESSPFINGRIGAGVQGESRGHFYGAEYMAERIYYTDADNDNETTQRLVGYWGTALSPRNNLDLGVQYLDSYDPRGQDNPRSGIRDTVDEEDPDTWKEIAYGGTYVYGTSGARGRLEVGGCLACREYDNNDQKYRDSDILDLGATLFWRVAPRTDGFVQVVYSDFDYTSQGTNDPTGGVSLDSEEWRYMVGATWEASKRTTGIVRIGQVDKDFEDSSRSDYNEFSWDGVVHWTPTSRDRFSLGYSRAPREALQWDADQLRDDFVEVETVDLAYARALGSSAIFDIGGYTGWDTWQPSGREDDVWGAHIGGRYNFKRWGSVGLSFFYEERDSVVDRFDYEDKGIMVDFNIGSLFGFGGSRAPDVCLQRRYTDGIGFNTRAGYQ